MTAVLETPVAAGLVLPSSFRAQMTSEDEPVHGDLREIFPRTGRRSRPDPVALLPGDYLLGEGGAPRWLRLDFVTHGATGSWACTTSGLPVWVRAGVAVWVWRAADVLAWAALGEAGGGAL